MISFYGIHKMCVVFTISVVDITYYYSVLAEAASHEAYMPSYAIYRKLGVRIGVRTEKLLGVRSM